MNCQHTTLVAVLALGAATAFAQSDPAARAAPASTAAPAAPAAPASPLTFHRTHHSQELQRVLPVVGFALYCDAGLKSLTDIQQRWKNYKGQVPGAADFVDASLAYLEQQVQNFRGTGLVAPHNDSCNANWLITPQGQFYLIDLESMALDDPAVDIGATLWWLLPTLIAAKVTGNRRLCQ